MHALIRIVITNSAPMYCTIGFDGTLLGIPSGLSIVDFLIRLHEKMPMSSNLLNLVLTAVGTQIESSVMHSLKPSYTIVDFVGQGISAVRFGSGQFLCPRRTRRRFGLRTS